MVEGTFQNKGTSSVEKLIDKNSPVNIDIESLFTLVKTKDKNKLIRTLSNNSNLYNPSEVDENGETPLIVACKHKRWVNAFTLLDFYSEDTNPGLIDKSGFSAFYYAASNVNLTERLLRLKSVIKTLTHIFPNGNSSLIHLLLNKCIPNIEICIDNLDINSLDHVNSDGKTAIIIAAEISEYAICKKLLSKNITLSFYDNNGMSIESYITSKNERENIELYFSMIDGINKPHNYKKRKNEKEFIIYSNDNFKIIKDINDGSGTYGSTKWIIDKSGNHKIIKFFKRYKGSKLIPDDVIKELIYTKKMNEKDNSTVSLDGIYMDSDNNLHLVFEPLFSTLNNYFTMLYHYNPKTPEEIKIKESRMVSIFENLDKILISIHSNGICHNDIKPVNLMYDYCGNLKIIDFGISDFLGFCPYKGIIDNYIATSYIKAPDYGKKTRVNIMVEINPKESKHKAESSFIYNASRKSFTSDIYSAGITMIQGILGRTDRFISINGTIYKELISDSMVKNKNVQRDELNFVKINDELLAKLTVYPFFNKLVNMINIDGNLRINRLSLDVHPTICPDSNNKLINRFISYNRDELRTQKYEMFYADRIFDNYKNSFVVLSPSIKRNECIDTFKRIIKLSNGKISIDSYYNALYNSINYSGSENIQIVCIAYLYLFSAIFEWKIRDVEAISIEFDIPSYILVGAINSLIMEFLPNVKIIPFVLIVQKIIILLQMSSTEDNIILNLEELLFEKLYIYLSGDPDVIVTDKVYIWDLVQSFSHLTLPSLPFEPSYKNNTILTVFSKFK